MQADAIPDWAIYILFAPVLPLTGFIHIALGVLQCVTIVGGLLIRVIIPRTRSEPFARVFPKVYLLFWMLPNVGTILWAVATDPAL